MVRRHFGNSVPSKSGGVFIAELDLITGFASRLTYEEARRDPEWSYDGSSIFYLDEIKIGSGFYQQQLDGSGTERLVRSDGYQVDLSPGGKWLAFARGREIIAGDLYTLNLACGVEIALDTTQASAGRPDFSPDSRYIVYSRFPGTGPAVRPVDWPGFQLHTDMAAMPPKWAPDGKYIYFLNPQDGIYRVPVRMEPRFQPIGEPEKVLSTSGEVSFDIDATGDTLAVTAGSVDFTGNTFDFHSTLIWTQNWAQSLSKE